jgi:hypothetical protein
VIAGAKRRDIGLGIKIRILIHQNHHQCHCWTDGLCWFSKCSSDFAKKGVIISDALEGLEELVEILTFEQMLGYVCSDSSSTW